MLPIHLRGSLPRTFWKSQRQRLSDSSSCRCGWTFLRVTNPNPNLNPYPNPNPNPNANPLPGGISLRPGGIGLPTKNFGKVRGRHSRTSRVAEVGGHFSVFSVAESSANSPQIRSGLRQTVAELI